MTKNELTITKKKKRRMSMRRRRTGETVEIIILQRGEEIKKNVTALYNMHLLVLFSL